MKWLLAMAVIAGLLWYGGDRFNEMIASGRQAAGGLAEPVYGLADTIDQTKARVEETNRKIGALAGHAAARPSAGGSAPAYGAAARRDLDALTSR